MNTVSYVWTKTALRPAMALAVSDRTTGNLFDFATGWTFAGKIALATDRQKVLATVSGARFTGSTPLSPSDPNLVMALQLTDVAGLDPDPRGTLYVVHIEATSGADLPMPIRADDPPSFLLYPTPA